MKFLVSARKTKYSSLGYIGICFYNKGNVKIIRNLYQIYTTCQSLFQVSNTSCLILETAL